MNVQFFHQNQAPTAKFAVNVMIVPDGTMGYPILLGKDSWCHFPRKQTHNTSGSMALEIWAVSRSSKETSPEFVQCVKDAKGLVEQASPHCQSYKLLHRDSKPRSLEPGQHYWIPIALISQLSDDQVPANYYTQSNEDWTTGKLVAAPDGKFISLLPQRAMTIEAN